jgi:hemimethylated DNA binding protein
MSTPGGARRLALALYKATLRWARQNADVPFSLRPADVHALAPSLRGSAVALQDAAAVRQIARAEFKAGKAAAGTEAQAALDRGLEALRLLNTSYAAQLAEMRAVRQERGDRSGVKFSVGQVFIHKKFGYRGVVYGWDRECQRDADWLKAMNVQNPQQPFFYVLPDETDTERLFGGVRITKYVAQENMEPLTDCRVVHRALNSYFDAYSAALGRYIPSRKLQWEYPDTYEAEDQAPVGDDSNILAQPEPEAPAVQPGPQPGFEPGRDFASP